MSILSSSGLSNLNNATANASAATKKQGSLSVNGLISGFDTDSLITGILAIDQSRIDALTANSKKITSVQTAFKGIEARMLTLQGNINSLARAQNSVFDVRSASSSNEDLLTVAASASAAPGVYRMQVNRLAQAHQIASQGFDKATSEISQGTFTLQSGQGSATITIDSTNNTLQGLANAINLSGAGVSAAIVNDGGGEDKQSYRLLLSSNSTGSTGRITLTNSLAASAGSAVKPAFDANFISNVQAGTNNGGTSAITSGGAYTGTSNNIYQFTVTQGGTVGTDNIQISYVDQAGATGTLSLGAGDQDVLKDLVNGVQLQFGAGTLAVGQTFSLKTTVPTVQEATDAVVTLGSGAGALTITSSTNQIDSLIPGVAVKLQSADPTKSVAITIASDTDKIKKAITDFVDSYNAIVKFIDDQSTYDAQTSTAGVLLGNRNAQSLQDQLRSVLSNVVPGANPRLNNLGALGITANDAGQLTIDDAKLSRVLTGQVPGVTLADARKLFNLSGSTSNANVQFVVGSTKTKSSGATPYQVHITQAAEHARLGADNTLGDSTVIDGTNNTLALSIDGIDTTITLAAGTYSRAALASELQARINADSTLASHKAGVTITDDRINITSNSYGSSAKIAVNASNALATLGFGTATSALGTDVAGHYVVNGKVETATGNGQFLIGSNANANTADLQLRITLTSVQVGAGFDADVNVSRGFASQMDAVLTNIFDPVNGRLKTIHDSFQANLDTLDEAKSRQTVLMESRRQSLLAQFAAMEDTLSKLQSTSQMLTSQLTTFNQQKG